METGNTYLYYRLLFYLIITNCSVNIEVFGNWNLVSESQRFETTNGFITGMLYTIGGSHTGSVNVLSGISYGSTNNNSRFNMPKRFQQWWKTTCVRYGVVCPQARTHDRKLEEQYPLRFIEQLGRKSHYSVFQAEDCSKLNLYLPNGGKM